MSAFRSSKLLQILFLYNQLIANQSQNQNERIFFGCFAVKTGSLHEANCFCVCEREFNYDFYEYFNLLFTLLKDKSGVDRIIVKKQPYQLLNASLEFFPSFHASNIYKFDD